MGDGAGAGDVAGVSLPADPPHGAARARGGAAGGRQSRRPQRAQGNATSSAGWAARSTRMALEVAETQTRLRQDIAERARVQRELENSEARLQQILNNATAVIYVKDIEGRLLFVNRQWERLFHSRHRRRRGKDGTGNAARGYDAGISQQRPPRPAAQCGDGVRGDRAARRRRAHLHLDQVPLARRQRRGLRRVRHLHRHHRAQALRTRRCGRRRRAIGRFSTPPRMRSSSTTSTPAPSSTSTPGPAPRSAIPARNSDRHQRRHARHRRAPVHPGRTRWS